MIRFILCICVVLSACMDTSAVEIEAPYVPYSAEEYMPENTTSFSKAIFELIKNVINKLFPVYKEASETLVLLVAIILVLSLAQLLSESGDSVSEFAGCCAISYILLSSSNAMVHIATDTIRQISDYGMLLIPVLTAALAAQGGVSSSTALYAGTAVSNHVLCRVISAVFVPLVYIFLALAIVGNATGEEMLNRISLQVKRFVCWTLKLFVTIFTTYMSMTGVVSGTTDAVALKATKNVISSAVPIIGGVLSESSEAILVSAEVAKNAAGIYGILAILALFLSPFLEIGVYYVTIKLASGICAFGTTKKVSALIDDFSGAMGMLLAMCGSVCIFFLVSTICFMKGMN